MSLWIQAEAMPGDTIESTAVEMRDLATRMGVGVQCLFNGVNLHMPVGGCDRTLVAEFHSVVVTERALKMAFGYPKRSS